MIHQSPARIYQSQQRAATGNNLYRLHATFDFEDPTDGSRKPFGALSILNDETAAPGQQVIGLAETGSLTLLIPLVGALEYTATDASQTIIPGEAAVLTSTEVVLKNPYNEEYINYLYVTFLGCSDNLENSISNFDQDVRNTFQPLLQQESLQCYIGVFNGRDEAVYKPANPANGLFIFVINGAFELWAGYWKAGMALPYGMAVTQRLKHFLKTQLYYCSNCRLPCLPHITNG